jgi:ABC-type sugar transport system ATPase subunit
LASSAFKKIKKKINHHHTMTRITLTNISKHYDNGFEAVKNLSLTLESGKFTVLLGPSGCGKTTTLRMIAGLEQISSGELLFDNERVNDTEPKHRDVGMVFQNYALYPHLSVFENIAFPLRLRRENKTAVETRVREVAEIIGLTELLERKPKQLSGGQRQRVALGRAIVRKPRVFLFDEPLSNLDAQLRTQMRVEISRLQRLVGSTAVYVTHDQTEAMTMADTIVVMRDGELQQTGTPQEIYASPANRFVAGFVGSPMMNFFEGEIVQSQAGTSNGAVFQEAGGIALPILRTLPNTLSKATLGIRPENIALEPFANNSAPMIFRAAVERIEFLGYERLVYVRTSIDAPLKIVRLGLSHTSIEAGTEYEWFVKQDAFCVFDSAGIRL